MLRSISWARFGAVVFLGLAAYYAYVIMRFYRKELWEFIKGRKEIREVPGPGMARAREFGQAGSLAVGKAVNDQGSMFAGEAAKVGETPEMFKVMEKVIVLLRQLVNDSVATGIRREELEDRIKMVLSGYRQLMRTPYQVSINNFIQRTCTTNFSFLLTDKEIAELWES